MTNQDNTNKLPPYALILAEVINYERGCLRVRLVDAKDGHDVYVEMDDSITAPLTVEEADEISKRYGADVPR